MKEMTAIELKQRLDRGDKIVIVDLREDYEIESGSIADLFIPLASLKARCGEIPRQDTVVMYCRTGKRAAAAVHVLEMDFGFDNLFCLCGGLEAWAADVDPDLTVY